MTVDIVEVAWVREACANGSARRLRIAARLSIYDAARAVGVNFSTVSRWERGQLPQREHAARYGAFLVELTKVVSLSGNRNAPEAVEGDSKTEADGPHATA